MNELHTFLWWTLQWEHPVDGIRTVTIHTKAHDVESYIRVLSRDHQAKEVLVRLANIDELNGAIKRLHDGKQPHL